MAVHDRLVIVGGCDGKRGACYEGVSVYDPVRDMWTSPTLLGSAPPPLHGASRTTSVPIILLVVSLSRSTLGQRAPAAAWCVARHNATHCISQGCTLTHRTTPPYLCACHCPCPLSRNTTTPNSVIPRPSSIAPYMRGMRAGGVRTGAVASVIGAEVLLYGGCRVKGSRRLDSSGAALARAWDGDGPLCTNHAWSLTAHFTGFDAPATCPHNCSGNGLCHRGVCACAPGFAGYGCEHRASCANNCSSHGICVHGPDFEHHPRDLMCGLTVPYHALLDHT